MANLTKPELLKYYSEPYGILELVSHLISHPNENYVVGQVEITRAEVLDLVDTYQRQFLPEPEIIDLNKTTNFRPLYTRILNRLKNQLETKVPDKETRDALVRTYRDHQKEFEAGPERPHASFDEVRSSITSAQKYAAQQSLVQARVSSALDAMAERQSVSDAARTYIRLRKGALEQDVLDSLNHIDTTDPIKARVAIENIIQQAGSSSPRWSTLESLLISKNDNRYHELAKDVGTLLSQEKISAEETSSYEKAIDDLHKVNEITYSTAKANLESSLSSWQESNLLSEETNRNLSKEVVASLRQTVIQETEKPSLLDQFRGINTSDPEVMIRRAIDNSGLAQKYHLSSVDVDRLTETISHSDGVGQYIDQISEGLDRRAPALVHLSPTSLTAYVAKSADVDPVVVRALSRGDSNIVPYLTSLGYSESEIRDQNARLQSYLANNQGVVGELYKFNYTTRASILSAQRSIQQGLFDLSTTGYVAKKAGLDPTLVDLVRRGATPIEMRDLLRQKGLTNAQIISQLENLKNFNATNQGTFGQLYKFRAGLDRSIARVQFALRPENLPVVGNIIHGYRDLTGSIGKWYGGVLDRHSTFAFLVSRQHRFAAFASWVERGIANHSLPTWFRTGLSFYKNGGYTGSGFWGELRKYYRIKAGGWLIKQGAKVGGEKFAGKFLAWVGSRLVTGTLSGGVGFAVQAGMWALGQIGKAPKAIENADVMAAWALKNLTGLAVLAAFFGPEFLGLVIGALAGILGVIFGLFSWPVILLLAGAGFGLGYLLHQGAIGAGINGGLASLGAGMHGLWVGIAHSAGTVAATFTSVALGSVLSTFVFNFIYNAAYTAANLSPQELDSRASASNNSPHLSVKKEVTASLNGDHKIDNYNLNQTIHYTITISAVDIPLTGAALKDTATIYNKDGLKTVLEKTETIGDLAVGAQKIITYDLPLNSSFADSYLNNAVTVTATSANGTETSADTQSLTIGQPPMPPMAVFAKNLAMYLKSCFGDTVTADVNWSCLKTKFNDPLVTDAVIAELKNSGVLYGGEHHYLQCVGFVQAVLVGTGHTTLTGTSHGIAADFITEIPKGYAAVSGTPMAGDLFVFPSRPGPPLFDQPGHIGIVVTPGDPLVVADANWNGKGGTRSETAIPANLVGIYLRPNP